MPDSIHLWLFLASTLADLTAAIFLLFARRHDVAARPPAHAIGLGRVFLAAAGTSLLFLFKLPLLAVLGVGFFGWIHLAYLDLAVMLPAAGLLVIAAGLKRRGYGARRLSPAVSVLAVLSLGAIPIGIDATFIEPFRLRLEGTSIRVPSPRAGAEPLRIGVLADIQTVQVTAGSST